MPLVVHARGVFRMGALAAASLQSDFGTLLHAWIAKKGHLAPNDRASTRSKTPRIARILWKRALMKLSALHKQVVIEAKHIDSHMLRVF